MSKCARQKVRFISVLVVTLLVPGAVLASAVKDKRLVPITSQQLNQAIQTTPVSSGQQEQLIYRARKSNLLDVAYSQYTLLSKRYPNNYRGKLLKGMVAEMLWQQSMDPDTRKRLSSPPPENLLQVAHSCLSEALKLAPEIAATNLECGFYLWQFGNDMQHGLALMQKALLLDPNSSKGHCLLGLVYSNPTGNAYNLQGAIKEFKMAVKIDASYAFPHSLLAGIYQQMKMGADAQREQLIFSNLLPGSS